MNILANAKTKLSNSDVKEAFKNEAGAIDLASIMVGIIVIGLIGGVIAATVFAVIPWAQDNASKQQLDSVAAAQSAYIGLSADANGGASTKFGGAIISFTGTGATADPYVATIAATSIRVVGADATVTESLFNGAKAKVVTGYYGSGSGAHYAAAARSASGKVFYITDTKTQPTASPAAEAAGTTQAQAVINAVVAASYTVN